MPKLNDLTDQKFGRWKVLRRVENHGSATRWLCQCECGEKKKVVGSTLTGGKSKSCGCLQRELTSKNHKVHGEAYTKTITTEYRIWVAMRKRCSNPKDSSYHNYGGRGITVCERWDNYENFLEDMGRRPTNGHSIDRIDVNGPYEPSNCKWSDKFEQSINKRIHPKNTSGYKGISKNENKWQVCINGKYVGIFSELEDAVEARKEAEKKYWNKSS